MEEPDFHLGIVVYDDVDYGLDLANAMHKARLTVSLYMSQKHVAAAIKENDRTKERIYELGLLDKDIQIYLYKFPRMRSPRSFIVTQSLIKTMYANGVTIAHLLMGPGEIWMAVLAHFLRIIPVISTIIIPEQNVGERLPGLVFKAVNLLLAHGSDMILVNGSSQVSIVEKTCKIPAHRIAYVPLGPRTTAVRWSSKRISEEPGTVLFFGAARAHKGLEFLIRAQPIINQQFPDAHFLIASRGDDLERCTQMIQDGIRFEIHNGFADGSAVATYFERASLVVLPYLSASTSGILVTAYVFGKPVVASSVGCLPEYVVDEVTGILVPPANEVKLAEAIVYLLSNNIQRQRMGANAKRWADDLESKIVLQTINVYKKAVSIHNKTWKQTN